MSTMNSRGSKVWHQLLKDSSRFSNVFGVDFDRESVEFESLVTHDEVSVSFYFNMLCLPDSAPRRWSERGNNAAEFFIVFNNPLILEVSGARSCFECVPIVKVSDEVTSLCVQSSDTRIICVGRDVSVSEIRPYIDSRFRNQTG